MACGFAEECMEVCEPGSRAKINKPSCILRAIHDMELVPECEQSRVRLWGLGHSAPERGEQEGTKRVAGSRDLPGSTEKQIVGAMGVLDEKPSQPGTCSASQRPHVVVVEEDERLQHHFGRV